MPCGRALVYFPTLLRTVDVLSRHDVVGRRRFDVSADPQSDIRRLRHVLRALGLGFLVREWFGDYHIAIYTLAVVCGWAFTGLPMMFYFAGLGDVPKETFDAARIEGAGHLAHDVAGRAAAVAAGHRGRRDADYVRVAEGVRSHRRDDQGRAVRPNQRSRLSRLSRKLLEFALRLRRDGQRRNSRVCRS